MPRPTDDERAAGDEDSLRELEELLRRSEGCQTSTVGCEDFGADRVDLSSEIVDETLDTIRKARDLRTRLRAAHAGADWTRCVFPDLITTLRERAGLSVQEVANAIGDLRGRDLIDLEQDKLDPFRLDSGAVASLMEVFSIHLGLLEGSLKNLLARRIARGGMQSTLARTSGSTPRADLENAMKDAAAIIAARRGTVAAVELPEGYLGAIRRQLDRWGRKDLLR